MGLLLGHCVAICPRSWHLWHTISLLHAEEVVVEEATVGAAVLVASHC